MTHDIRTGDTLEVLRTLPENSVNCCVTSPPYWGLRSYFPDYVQLKSNVPADVMAELASLGIKPVDNAGG